MQLERIRFQDVFSFRSDLRGHQNPRYALSHFTCLVETDRPLMYYTAPYGIVKGTGYFFACALGTEMYVSK